MKLLVATKSKRAIQLEVHLTGRIDFFAAPPGVSLFAKIARINVIEVAIVGDNQLLWVTPDDLWDDTIGCGYHERELREMVEKIAEAKKP